MMISGVISDTIGRLPAMKITEPYSPTARAKASAKPVSSAGSSVGSTTRRNVCQRVAPRLAAASSISVSRSSSTGCTVRTTNGRPMKIERHEHAERREGDLDAERLEVLAEPAVLGVERGQRDAGHRRRQRERQVDQRVDERLAREACSAPAPTPAGGRTRH